MNGLLFIFSMGVVLPPPVPATASSSFGDRLLDEPKGRLERFLDYQTNAVKGVFHQNPNWYLNGIDFTCVSPWNSASGRLRAGTAISKRHIIFAKHYPVAVGARMAFVGDTGAVSHYTVTGTRALEGCDIMIGALDAELTPDIRPAKVLPVNFEKWITDGRSWPLVTFNQHEQAFLCEMTSKWNQQAGMTILQNKLAGSYSARQYGGTIIVGDSGDPAFLMYGECPILVYCLLSGGLGYGPFIHRYRAQIQQAMDALVPRYHLNDFDFEKSVNP